MLRVAYIELDTHAEIARNFRELSRDFTALQVDFYFSPRILSELQISATGNVHKSDSTIILEQLQAQSYDLVLIGTAHRYFSLFLEIQKRFNTYVITHNLNFPKRSRSFLLKAVFKSQTVYRLKLLLKEGLLSAPKVFADSSRLLVLDGDLHKGAAKVLPLFYTKSTRKKAANEFQLVIPGEVSQKRRDYREVLKKLKEYGEKASPLESSREALKRVHVVFLGRASGKELRWLEELKYKHYASLDIEFFTHKVSSSHFDEVLSRADLIWCPLHKKTRFFGGVEIYGTTKMTGAIGDAIKFSTSLLLPTFYKSSCPLVQASKVNTIASLLDRDSLGDLSYERYQKAEVSNALERLLLQLK
ncbi:hypothetical protein [Chryseobacterium sp. A301]